MRAPLPRDEPARITALRRYAILDTAEEEAFNRITRLASSICQASIAAISLIDENRLWFKSRINIDICEADRDISFCSHVILDRTVLGCSGRHCGSPICGQSCRPWRPEDSLLCWCADLYSGWVPARHAMRCRLRCARFVRLVRWRIWPLVIEELEHRQTEAHLKVANNELE